MNGVRMVLTGGRVFDGKALCDGLCVVVEGACIADILPADAAPAGEICPLDGDILCPMFVDLQVNGGGGVLLNDAPNEAGLAAIASAHRAAGTGTLLPTLITDTPQVTRAAIDAVAQTQVPGIVGLHLEGPHIAPAKAGAHDPALIRPLGDADLALYLDAARRLPRLVITLAPEAATPEAVTTLTKAGVIVSLGHSAADFDTADAYFAAGATMATHLFNAMGPLHHRDPGLAGAALATPGVAAGLIGDGQHVHPAMVGAAVRAKSGASGLFLVTDAMAPFGTDMAAFELNGRTVAVDGARLTLADGTLAGANTDMLGLIRCCVADAGVPLDTALAMATSAAADAARLARPAGHLSKGGPTPLRLAGDLSALKPLI